MKPSAAFLLVIIALTQTGLGQDWPQWRGPNRDGVVAVFKRPKKWPDQLELKWKVSVGEGHASPVVFDKRVYLHSRQGEQEMVSCFELSTGRLLWRDGYDAPYTPDQAAVKHGKGPHSTPAVADGKIYTLGMTQILSCYDIATGKLKWRREFSKEFKKTSPDYGTATSPMVDSDLLITYVGGKDNGSLIAFDVATGKEKWRWAGDGPGYSSPIVVELSGVRQAVVLSQQNIIGVAISTGELLWQIPFKTEYDNSIVSPVYYKNTLIFSGDGKGTFAVKPSRCGGKWTVETLWHNTEIEMYLNSPVVGGDYLFGMSATRKGQFFCVDARTGVTLWTSEGREGDNAAISRAGSILFFLADDAELTIARADQRRYEVLKKYTVAESPTWAHPVILHKHILIRDANTLALWRLN